MCCREASGYVGVLGSGFTREVTLEKGMPARTRYLKAEWESRRLSVNHMCRKGIFTSEMSCLAGLFQQRNDGEPHPVCRTKDKDGMSKEGTPAKVPGLR